MLHASGRQVPIIVSYLKTQLKEDDYERLQLAHGKCFFFSPSFIMVSLGLHLGLTIKENLLLLWLSGNRVG